MIIFMDSFAAYGVKEPSMVTQTFYSKTSKKTEGPPLGFILKRSPVKGEVGIEIEVEGNAFRKQAIPSPWSYHKEDSLRGNDHAEYVLTKPISFKKVPEAVGKLWDMFKEDGSKLDVSNRTSVHVHMNAQTWHLNRLAAFVGMYLSVEELLTEWCGDHRVGNLFCLRGKDAHYIVSEVKRFIQRDGNYALDKNAMHYAGLNVGALVTYGSLEIRSLRGCTDPETVLTWVGILERMYRKSADFSDPRSLIADFSGTGPAAYLDLVLGEYAPVIKSALSWSPERVRDSVYEGIRLAQDVCYCRDWSLYTPVEVKADPFGRAMGGAPPTFSMWAVEENPVPDEEPENEEPDYDPEPEYDEEETEE